MEKISANSDKQEARMPNTLAHDDLPLARDLLKAIAGDCWHGKGDMIDRVYDEISARFRQWTRRRVRSIWHQECAGIRFHEMRELAATAEAVAADRQRIEAGRAAHAQFIAETAALAARLQRQDEDFHRGAIDALNALAGRQSHRHARLGGDGCIQHCAGDAARC